ncbi:hypothetical protein ACRWOO_03020 [Streptomyces sp. NEAU-PBA10]|uniref:Uncharacterized protein n=1 Tax=Streptomyces griseiscabiei TaxID=2993540 RepID=A0ABU4LFR6_9ACTN|nr:MULTISPECIES: hypothetical protein [Streptomyces]MBZ3908516.1 hypothetical protein [Streptomyces griseiscabiei]MDX2914034.1 hypothetical protein [Streptomyces griseiscabiei]
MAKIDAAICAAHCRLMTWPGTSGRLLGPNVGVVMLVKKVSASRQVLAGGRIQGAAR